MDIIIEILKNYWKEIISVVLFITSFIIAILRKRPVNDVLTYIYEFCVKYIKEAEDFKVILPEYGESSLVGPDKKMKVVNDVLNNLKQIFPRLDVKSYKVIISAIVEDILSTPQKKVR